MDGKPYEVMGGLSENIEMPSSISNGVLRKIPRKTRNARYDFIAENGLVIKDIAKMFDNYNNEVLTRMVLYL